jgi:microcystin-dependent protein
MAVLSTSPATLFGFGTWVAWGTGRVPMGMGSNGTTNYTTVEATGGAETVTLDSTMVPNHTHTATAALESSHTHTGTTGGESATHNHSTTNTLPGENMSLGWAAGAGGSAYNPPILANSISNNTTDHTHSFTTSSGSSHTHTITVNATTGGGGSHNNMQPYIICYMWKRTA